MKKLPTILKYIDVFGTRFTFFNNKTPRLYTVIGGILSMISIFVCLLSFISFSFDDLYRRFPIVTISSIPTEGYRKIKFGKEKIWIPWRIVDYNNNHYINHTDLLFPIIYYYSGIKNNQTKNFNLTSKLLNYKLCSETSMANENNIYQFKIPLNNIYCIEMDDLDMGGSFINEFIHYIRFDIYFCKDGMSYNETNSKCSSYDKIMDYLGNNNSLEIDFYYPTVHFQPNNKSYPLIVIYKQHFYHISKYVNKIERLFLQENVITDDSGWLLRKETNKSYWGINSIDGDTYYSGKDKDLMNEGSNSRIYSFNLYLEPGIIHYKRYYKKLHIIFSDFFPVAHIIFIIMKNISKIFKKAESNKKLIELLFENLKEKKILFKNNLEQLKINNGRFSLKYSNKALHNPKENNLDINFFNSPKLSVDLQQNIKKNIKSSVILNNQGNSSNNNISSNLTKIKNRQSNNRLALNKNSNNFTNYSKQNLMVSEAPYIILNSSVNNTYQDIQPSPTKRRFIKQQLFPAKFYIFSVCIKNLDISKKNIFFSRKFSKIYIFLSQLFDITAYLALQREFNVLKKILKEKDLNSVEKYQKINVNNPTFIQEINDCIKKEKFHILAK